jgi:formiminotetrahydrofolate cyclodeaminase
VTSNPDASQPARPLAELTVNQLLERLSSSAPIPGGGSAAAIAGAMGAGLVAMVAALTVGRAEYADAELMARELGAAATTIRDELMQLAQRDSEAYEAVVHARRLPRDTDEQRSARAASLAEAMRLAAEIPFETARVAVRAVELAARIAPIGNRHAVSDAGVAAQLASAAVRGAILNVRINLPYLPPDAPLRTEAPAELERLEATALNREAAALADVAARLG